MNGYELSRNWFNFCFENPEKIKPIHSAIFFFAIEHCNRLGGKDKFGFPSQMTMDAIGVKKYQTYGKALNDLSDWGFITFVERSKNQYSSNIISINATPKNGKARGKALDKATIKYSIKSNESVEFCHAKKRQSTRQSTRQSMGQSMGQSTGQGMDSIVKPINQEPIDSAIVFFEGENAFPTFNDFWDSYDKKVDRKKAKAKWDRLPKKVKEEIMIYIPKYVKATPDKKFRKDPCTFLNNESWTNELPDYSKPTKKLNPVW